MKSFTIRGIDDRLYDEIKKRSANKSTSINKFILTLLEVSTGFKKEKKKSVIIDYVRDKIVKKALAA